jgi:predicted O-methyltransferase YrrM
MQRYRLPILMLSLVLVALVGASAHSGEAGKMTDAEREQFLKNFNRTGMDTTPDDAMFLRILVEARKAKCGVEVGSYKGFGAINMGIGFERNGGHLTTLEINPGTADACRANLKKVGLEKTVTCITGNALKTLPELKGQFDFVFLDARKSDYFKYLKALEPKLVPGAVIVADNTIRSAKAVQDFLTYLRESPDYEMVTIRASLEKKDGMTVAYKIR